MRNMRVIQIDDITFLKFSKASKKEHRSASQYRIALTARKSQNDPKVCEARGHLRILLDSDHEIVVVRVFHSQKSPKIL